MSSALHGRCGMTEFVVAWSGPVMMTQKCFSKSHDHLSRIDFVQSYSIYFTSEGDKNVLCNKHSTCNVYAYMIPGRSLYGSLGRRGRVVVAA